MKATTPAPKAEQLDLIKVRRPLLRYHGGKWTLAPWLISNFPAHDIYCEPFGGAASVLLRKPRSRVEVYNDLDSEVVTLFRVMRDRQQAEKLLRLVNLTPFSREEFKAAYELSTDPLERSRRLVVRSHAGFGSHSHNPANSNGFRWMPTRNYAREWARVPHALQAIVERLQGVIIEHDHAPKVIKRIDSADTFFLIDPPYPEATRDAAGKGYAFEMLDGEHHQLATLLKAIKGKVMICGYRCGLYDHLYAGWRCEERLSYANGQNGRSERTEVIWMNY